MRRVNVTAGAFTMVASPGSSKEFTDVTLPVGVDRVEYMIQPKRNEVLGPQSNVFTVQFGSVVGSAGMSIAALTSTPHQTPMKVAA
jgi:hypothetical protein